jgi:excisionase family DNA binding protein
MKDYLTLSEAAKHLKLTRQAVLYAVKTGRLPAVRAGRQWMVHKANIDRAYFVNIWDSKGKLIRDPALPVYEEAEL